MFTTSVDLAPHQGWALTGWRCQLLLIRKTMMLCFPWMWSHSYMQFTCLLGFTDSSDRKESACKAGHLGSIPGQHIKKQRHHFANKCPSSQSYGFSNSHVWMWELDYKESWVSKNWCFWTVVLEKTLESPLDCKEIQPVHPKGNQSWVYIGRTDVEAETPILWPPDVKTYLKRPWCW